MGPAGDLFFFVEQLLELRISFLEQRSGLDHFFIGLARSLGGHDAAAAGQRPHAADRLWSAQDDDRPGEGRHLAPELDALIVMDQAGVPNTGVISQPILKTVRELSLAYPRLVILADSRHGLGHFPPLVFKMNAAEFVQLTRASGGANKRVGEIDPASAALPLTELQAGAERLAAASKRAVFITLAERGIVGAAPGQPAVHVPALPLRGEIDIVGAGDASGQQALTVSAGTVAAIDQYKSGQIPASTQFDINKWRDQQIAAALITW
jgi:hypothetical protein